jgi:acetyl esterase
MPLDPEIAAFLERQKAEPPRSSLDVAGTRQMLRRSVTFAGPPPELPYVREIGLTQELRGRDYRPELRDDLPILVFFHGGRFFSGDLDSHDVFCRMLAQSARCRVIAVDYRLAPEHPFPAAADDALTAVDWALRQGVPVSVAGDSAGANLAAGATLARRGTALRCQVLIYPMIDATCSLPSYVEFQSGYGPGAEDMRRGWRLYLPEGADPRDERSSPLFARDVTAAAPALVITAEYDTLRDEGEAYARRLQEAGVPLTLTRYHGAIHGFCLMTGLLESARRLTFEVSEFLLSHW